MKPHRLNVSCSSKVGASVVGVGADQEIEILRSQLQAWRRKPCLRMIYEAWFREIRAYLVPGITLEIGGGIGRLKDHDPGLISLDIAKTPWVDIIGDAQGLPFKYGSVSNLILIDTLHHVARPFLFFQEALRILGNGGRIIMVEPYISPVSRFMFAAFHPEPACMNCDPFQTEIPLSTDHPFDANQAVATIIFFKQFEVWQERFPAFKMVQRKRFALFAYPATGGFSGRQLLPDRVIGILKMMEDLFAPLARWLAFRALVVLQKDI